MNNPIFCDIGITGNCLFQCKMCRLWESADDPGELSVQEWKDFLSALEEFSPASRLHFAGGEPLMKEGILDIIGFAHRKGFTTVMVSNGFLIDETLACRIADSGLDVISISLDTLDTDKHDFLRGRRMAGKQALQAIGYLNKQGVKSISILAVIMGPNLEDLIELAEWVNGNAALSSIYFQAISQPIATAKDPAWYAHDDFGFLWPKDHGRVSSVIDRMISYKKRGYKISNSVRQLDSFKEYFRQPESLHHERRCTQGDYVIYIRPAGDVLLCGSLAPVGNIRRGHIRDIWNSPESDLRRQQIYACKENCLNLLNCFEDKELP